MKEVLFLNGKYVTSISELRKMINNNPSLEEELVSSCKDKVLVNWMRSQDLNQWKEKNWKNREEEMILDVLEYSDTQVDKEDVSSVVESLNNLETESLSGIRLFGELHKKITGKECGNLDSSFGSFAQLISVSYGKQTYKVENKRANIFDGFGEDITFIFRTLKRNSENVNLILIAIGENGRPIPSNSHSVKRTQKIYGVDDEFQITFPVESLEEAMKFKLQDEKCNTICEIVYLGRVLRSKVNWALKLVAYEFEGRYCCVVKWDYLYLRGSYLPNLPDYCKNDKGFTKAKIEDLKESLCRNYSQCDIADVNVAQRLCKIGAINRDASVAIMGEKGSFVSSKIGKGGEFIYDKEWKPFVEYVAFSFEGNPFV